MLVFSVIITGTSLPPARGYSATLWTSSVLALSAFSRLSSRIRRKNSASSPSLEASARLASASYLSAFCNAIVYSASFPSSYLPKIENRTGAETQRLGPKPRSPRVASAAYCVPPADQRLALPARLLTSLASSPCRYALEDALHQS